MLVAPHAPRGILTSDNPLALKYRKKTGCSQEDAVARVSSCLLRISALVNDEPHLLQQACRAAQLRARERGAAKITVRDVQAEAERIAAEAQTCAALDDKFGPAVGWLDATAVERAPASAEPTAPAAMPAAVDVLGLSI